MPRWEVRFLWRPAARFSRTMTRSSISNVSKSMTWWKNGQREGNIWWIRWVFHCDCYMMYHPNNGLKPLIQSALTGKLATLLRITLLISCGSTRVPRTPPMPPKKENIILRKDRHQSWRKRYLRLKITNKMKGSSDKRCEEFPCTGFVECLKLAGHQKFPKAQVVEAKSN